ALAGMATTVRGHGFITSPKARMPGDAFEAACGQQVYYNQAGDNYGNIQGELQVAKTQSDYNAEKCQIWLCKGYKYEDNKDLVETYTPGQKVPIKFDVRAPHDGTANVSVVDTATNTIIGTPLISWDVYASSASAIPADQTSFEVTIPEDLGSKCSTPGACVLQHFWDARSVDQTYESCIDFTVSGSGSGAAPASSKAASSSAAPVSSAASSSSAPAKAPITSTEAASSAAQPTTMATIVKSSSAAPVSSSSASGSVAAWGQCGGKGFTGATACVSGYTCKVQNDYYSQCIPGENKVTDASSPAASSSSCTTTITLTKSSSAAANTM
ncbi:chitin binding protein, partial [Aureobasidium melanogenum]